MLFLPSVYSLIFIHIHDVLLPGRSDPLLLSLHMS